MGSGERLSSSTDVARGSSSTGDLGRKNGLHWPNEKKTKVKITELELTTELCKAEPSVNRQIKWASFHPDMKVHLIF